ncbi:MAG TPA: ParB/RepB/Spo0J family partition protein [Rickettsiales bacterium]|nr:ParB/RepB/Spo0J family partition protein [Rickettsiales bacterium]
MSAVKKSNARGLGKGLSALMSDTYSQAPAAPAQPANQDRPEQSAAELPKQTLKLSQLRSGKYQPREHFNESALSDLANSIKKNGVMQPILVRMIGADLYEIVAGERRWRASKIAGLDEIPVVIRDLTDEQALELAIVENVQREGLHPLEEAAGYQRLMDEFGYTQENIASTVHKSRSHIANLLRLLSLPKDIQELLTTEKLTMGHARALIGVESASQIAEEIIRRNLSVRQTEKLVSDSKNPNREPKAQKPREPKTVTTTVTTVAVHQGPKDQDILALEAALSENLGLKVSINDRGQAGEITVAYESLEQLDDVLRRLGGSI